jgi:hypothetical protein
VVAERFTVATFDAAAKAAGLAFSALGDGAAPGAHIRKVYGADRHGLVPGQAGPDIARSVDESGVFRIAKD